MLLTILGVIAAALAAGAVVFFGVKLTISLIKKYKKKKSSKVLAATVKDLIKKAPSMKIDDLDDDDIILAEYDEEKDELVQDVKVADQADSQVRNILETNNGIVVFE